MAKITITQRRCKRCHACAPSAPPAGLCPACSKNWQVVNGNVVAK